MKILKEQIKSKQFSSMYLFTGEEKYLIDVYLKRYVDAIFDGGDRMMNYDQFNADNKDIDKIESSLETLPFFADKRVVLLDNLDLFNKKNKSRTDRIVESLKDLPNSTICFLVEDAIDKRSKLYKLIKGQGTFYEFGFLSEKDLIQYVGRELKKANIKISTVDAQYFINTVGYELRSIVKEVGKLIDYAGNDDLINRKAIDDVCSKHLEGKIFDLVDAVGLKNRQRALGLYNDMLALKEPTQRIFFMISRQFTLVFQCKLMVEKRISQGHIAKELKVPDFVARKLIAQSKEFSLDSLKLMIKELVELENNTRIGKIKMETGIELMILKLSVY